MILSKAEVEHVAKLAQLKLKDEEVERYLKQLSEIIDYNMSLLGQVKTDDVDPTAQVTGLETVVREDEPRPSLSQEEVLKNASQKENGYFITKAVLGE
jgi:aspartyl-tRNA(Asn)/glutamyl-tRNA(Gln) amidotransferase subunit C